MALAAGVAASAMICCCERLLVLYVPLLTPVQLPEVVYDAQSGTKLKKLEPLEEEQEE